ncbi:uncharacterized protein LOC118198934 [Stegodyphus dumicola]|uniref:uncharacterized protein LOC118198934 n=1 Tax=Stegodyphus dumicola TaxID=202533 RepID=UPI0015AE9129|nr:uncharacterized protein LOC118198934 [Stegodyphus dumicola]
MNLKLILLIPVYAVTISSSFPLVSRTGEISDTRFQNFVEENNNDSFNTLHMEPRQKRQLNLFGSDSRWAQVLRRVFAEIVKQVRNALQNRGYGNSRFMNVFNELLRRLTNEDPDNNDSSSSQDFVDGLRKLANDGINQYLKRIGLNVQ